MGGFIDLLKVTLARGTFRSLTMLISSHTFIVSIDFATIHHWCQTPMYRIARCPTNLPLPFMSDVNSVANETRIDA